MILGVTAIVVILSEVCCVVLQTLKSAVYNLLGCGLLFEGSHNYILALHRNDILLDDFVLPKCTSRA